WCRGRVLPAGVCEGGGCWRVSGLALLGRSDSESGRQAFLCSAIYVSGLKLGSPFGGSLCLGRLRGRSGGLCSGCSSNLWMLVCRIYFSRVPPPPPPGFFAKSSFCVA